MQTLDGIDLEHIIAVTGFSAARIAAESQQLHAIEIMILGVKLKQQNEQPNTNQGSN